MKTEAEFELIWTENELLEVGQGMIHIYES